MHAMKAAFTLFLLAISAGFAAGGEPAGTQATLMPLWTPQAQFAGYYVALGKGMYARRGIDLRILASGPGHVPTAALEDGTADFVVLWLTTAIRHRAAGTKLVNLAQILGTSSMMLVAKRTSGIRTVADMNGRKVGLWGGDLSIPPRALFAKLGVKVREVRQSATVNLFLRGGIDVASAMWFNEYHTILDSGVDADELTVFFLKDYGVSFPEDGLYALEETIERDPALADAFLEASFEGWRYAFDHTEEALDLVMAHMREAHVSANRVHQRWMLARMRELVLPGEPTDSFGALDERDYRAVANALVEAGAIREAPEYHELVRSTDARP